MKKKYCLLLIIIVLLFLGKILFFQNSLEKDDFYSYVNEDTLKKNYLKDKSNWSRFTEAQEEVDDKKYALFSLVVSGNQEIDVNFSQVVSEVYQNVSDYSKREQEGLSSLKYYIDSVFSSQNIEELENIIFQIEKDLDIDILTSFDVDLDSDDTSKTLVYLSPVSFAFGASSDYFVNDDYMTYKAYIKRGIIQLLEVYGYDKNTSHEMAKKLISFYEDIGKSSKLSSQLMDTKNIYHKVRFEELKSIYSRVNIDQYFSSKGIVRKNYNIVDQGQYQKLNAYLSDEYLDLWKNHLLVMILSHYASYLSSDYVDVIQRLNEDMGMDIENNLEKRNMNLVLQLFSSEFSYYYGKKYQNKGIEQYLKDTFLEIKNTYQEMLLHNEWLSSKTKKRAVAKLEKMKLVTGSGDKDFSLFSSFNLGNNLIENIIQINHYQNLLKVEKEKSFVREVNHMEVNAYYSPISQTVYVPTAMYSLIDLKKDKDIYLGSIGMILAHEVSHGFDFNGSWYDEDGNYLEWWSKQDRENYQKYKKKIVDYYSKYEVSSGLYIDGNRTVNENIADLSAIQCISKILLNKKASDEEIRLVYQEYARLWVEESSEEYQKLLLLVDTHAPNKYRVNAVLSSTDTFYQVYSLMPWDKMYISKEKRVKVW